MFPIYMYICSAQSRKFAQSRDCAAQSQNPETVRQSRDCAAPVHNLEIKQFLLRTQVEFPSCITSHSADVRIAVYSHQKLFARSKYPIFLHAQAEIMAHFMH